MPITDENIRNCLPLAWKTVEDNIVRFAGKGAETTFKIPAKGTILTDGGKPKFIVFNLAFGVAEGEYVPDEKMVSATLLLEKDREEWLVKWIEFSIIYPKPDKKLRLERSHGGEYQASAQDAYSFLKGAA